MEKCPQCGYNIDTNLSHDQKKQIIDLYKLKVPQRLRKTTGFLADKIITINGMDLDILYKLWLNIYSFYTNYKEEICIIDGINDFVNGNHIKKNIEYLFAIIRNKYNKRAINYEYEQTYLESLPPE